MPEPLHILLINNYAIRCGIAGFVADMAKAMAGRGHKVTIYSQKPWPVWYGPIGRVAEKLRELSDAKGRKPLPRSSEGLAEMYGLGHDITVEAINFSDRNANVRKVRERIKALDPDVCLSPQADGAQLVWAATLLGTGVPFINSEHHSPVTIENVFWTRSGRLAAMSGADAIHLLLPCYLDSIPEFFRDRCSIIPNAVKAPNTCANTVGGERKTLLWLGRLHEELKQCRLALEAFAMIAAKYPDWNLHVAGDGQDRKLIHASASELMARNGLEGRILLLGEQKDVWPVYAGAQAFCFSSATEGQPRALQEAMASGLPCVGFSACDGVPDLIRDNETGLLAREMTAAAMAATLEKLLGDEKLRVRLGQAAREAMKAYAPEKIYDQWEDLFYRTAAKKGSTRMDAFMEEEFAGRARLSAMARREWLWRDFGDPMPDELEGQVYYRMIAPMKNAIKNFLRR